MRQLTAEERFIEALGLFLEQLGFPRIAGRILALLLCNGVPMHLDQITSALEVSRASVSTNTRLLVGTMLLEELAQPGDRRTWFSVRPDAFRRRFGFIITQFASLSELLQQGLDSLPPEREVARKRLGEAVEFHQFLVQELIGVSERWDSLKGDMPEGRWQEIPPDQEEGQ